MNKRIEQSLSPLHRIREIIGIKKSKNTRIGRETPAPHSMYDFSET